MQVCESPSILLQDPQLKFYDITKEFVEHIPVMSVEDEMKSAALIYDACSFRDKRECSILLIVSAANQQGIMLEMDAVRDRSNFKPFT